jgi:hypothetical protein
MLGGMWWLAMFPGCAEVPEGTPGDLPARWFIADPGAGVVFEDGPDGRAVAVDASTPGASAGFDPAALAVGAGGELLVADFAEHTVAAWDGAGLELRYQNPADPQGVRVEELCALAATPTSLALLGNDTENVLFLDAAGQPTGELGPAAELRGAHGFVALPGGALAVVATPAPGEPAVTVWDAGSGEVVRAFGHALALPTDVVLRADGTLAIADWKAGLVRGYTLAGDDLGALATGLDRPVALAEHAGVLLILAQDGVWTDDGRHLADGEGLQFPRDLALAAAP